MSLLNFWLNAAGVECFCFVCRILATVGNQKVAGPLVGRFLTPPFQHPLLTSLTSLEAPAQASHCAEKYSDLAAAEIVP